MLKKISKTTKFLIFGALWVFISVLVVLAASPVTDTFTDETKISASTQITVDTGAGQVKLSVAVAPWACGDPVAYDGGPYDADGISQTTGGYYRTVLIGTQCWFKDSLNVGTAIGSKLADNTTLQNQTNNATIEKYCYNYVDDDDPSQIASGIADCAVGGFYQWPEAVQYSNGVTLTSGTTVAEGNIQGICPTGWHIPSDAEYTTLSTYLGGDSVSGGHMKSTTGFFPPNTGADNSSGFTGLASGYRKTDGSFSFRGVYTRFWSTLPSGTADAFHRLLRYNGATLSRFSDTRAFGFSVRCLKD